MATDVRPLGAPELGMTRAEMLDQATANFQLFSSTSEMFFALLFAYVVAIFIAGNQLTRVQYTLANAMYLLVMFGTLSSAFIAATIANTWLERAGLTSATEWLPVSSTAVRTTLVATSIWFGNRVRHSPETARSRL